MFPTCIVKNTSGGSYNLRNASFASDGDTYIIPDVLRMSWASDSAVLDAIVAEDIQIGDGAQFFTDHSEQIDWLKSYIPSPMQAEVTSTVSPALTTSGKVEHSYTGVDLNQVWAYTDLYTYSGEADLHGFTLKFNSDKVWVHLEIDGETILEEDCEELTDFEASPSWIEFNDKVFKFRPPYPYRISSSIKIQAKANSSSNGRDCDAWWVIICK